MRRPEVWRPFQLERRDAIDDTSERATWDLAGLLVLLLCSAADPTIFRRMARSSSANASLLAICFSRRRCISENARSSCFIIACAMRSMLCGVISFPKTMRNSASFFSSLSFSFMRRDSNALSRALESASNRFADSGALPLDVAVGTSSRSNVMTDPPSRPIFFFGGAIRTACRALSIGEIKSWLVEY